MEESGILLFIVIGVFCGLICFICWFGRMINKIDNAINKKVISIILPEKPTESVESNPVEAVESKLKPTIPKLVDNELPPVRIPHKSTCDIDGCLKKRREGFHYHYVGIRKCSDCNRTVSFYNRS